jgi:hypothetical protein
LDPRLHSGQRDPFVACRVTLRQPVDLDELDRTLLFGGEPGE